VRRLDRVTRHGLDRAENTISANPVWIQIMMTMMKKLFHGIRLALV
jgi:hypothetical protein